MVGKKQLGLLDVYEKYSGEDEQGVGVKRAQPGF